jgi:hypothetical protein
VLTSLDPKLTSEQLMLTLVENANSWRAGNCFVCASAAGAIPKRSDSNKAAGFLETNRDK